MERIGVLQEDWQSLMSLCFRNFVSSGSITVLSACSFVWGPEAFGLNWERLDLGEEKGAVESTSLPLGPWLDSSFA